MQLYKFRNNKLWEYKFLPLLIVLSSILGSQQNLPFNTKLHILSACQHNPNPKIQSNDQSSACKSNNQFDELYFCLYFNRADYIVGGVSTWYLNNQCMFSLWYFHNWPVIHCQIHMLIYDKLWNTQLNFKLSQKCFLQNTKWLDFSQRYQKIITVLKVSSNSGWFRLFFLEYNFYISPEFVIRVFLK